MDKLTKDQKRQRKLKERATKRAKPKITVSSICVECGKPCYFHEEYVVKDETWAEAGMVGWASGRLHRTCLEKRLGRTLQPEELLAWPASPPRLDGSFEMRARPEYVEYVKQHGPSKAEKSSSKIDS
jgi:hypothetical protein